MKFLPLILRYLQVSSPILSANNLDKGAGSILNQDLNATAANSQNPTVIYPVAGLAQGDAEFYLNRHLTDLVLARNPEDDASTNVAQFLHSMEDPKFAQEFFDHQKLSPKERRAAEKLSEQNERRAERVIKDALIKANKQAVGQVVAEGGEKSELEAKLNRLIAKINNYERTHGKVAAPQPQTQLAAQPTSLYDSLKDGVSWLFGYNTPAPKTQDPRDLALRDTFLKEAKNLENYSNNLRRELGKVDIIAEQIGTTQVTKTKEALAKVDAVLESLGSLGKLADDREALIRRDGAATTATANNPNTVRGGTTTRTTTTPNATTGEVTTSTTNTTTAQVTTASTTTTAAPTTISQIVTFTTTTTTSPQGTESATSSLSVTTPGGTTTSTVPTSSLPSTISSVSTSADGTTTVIGTTTTGNNVTISTTSNGVTTTTTRNTTTGEVATSTTSTTSAQVTTASTTTTTGPTSSTSTTTPTTAAPTTSSQGITFTTTTTTSPQGTESATSSLSVTTPGGTTTSTVPTSSLPSTISSVSTSEDGTTTVIGTTTTGNAVTISTTSNGVTTTTTRNTTTGEVTTSTTSTTSAQVTTTSTTSTNAPTTTETSTANPTTSTTTEAATATTTTSSTNPNTSTTSVQTTSGGTTTFTQSTEAPTIATVSSVSTTTSADGSTTTTIQGTSSTGAQVTTIVNTSTTGAQTVTTTSQGSTHTSTTSNGVTTTTTRNTTTERTTTNNPTTTNTTSSTTSSTTTENGGGIVADEGNNRSANLGGGIVGGLALTAAISAIIIAAMRRHRTGPLQEGEEVKYLALVASRDNSLYPMITASRDIEAIKAVIKANAEEKLQNTPKGTLQRVGYDRAFAELDQIIEKGRAATDQTMLAELGIKEAASKDSVFGYYVAVSMAIYANRVSNAKPTEQERAAIDKEALLEAAAMALAVEEAAIENAAIAKPVLGRMPTFTNDDYTTPATTAPKKPLTQDEISNALADKSLHAAAQTSLNLNYFVEEAGKRSQGEGDFTALNIPRRRGERRVAFADFGSKDFEPFEEPGLAFQDFVVRNRFISTNLADPTSDAFKREVWNEKNRILNKVRSAIKETNLDIGQDDGSKFDFVRFSPLPKYDDVSEFLKRAIEIFYNNTLGLDEAAAKQGGDESLWNELDKLLKVAGNTEKSILAAIEGLTYKGEEKELAKGDKNRFRLQLNTLIDRVSGKVNDTEPFGKFGFGSEDSSHPNAAPSAVLDSAERAPENTRTSAANKASNEAPKANGAALTRLDRVPDKVNDKPLGSFGFDDDTNPPLPTKRKAAPQDPNPTKSAPENAETSAAKTASKEAPKASGKGLERFKEGVRKVIDLNRKNDQRKGDIAEKLQKLTKIALDEAHKIGTEVITTNNIVNYLYFKKVLEENTNAIRDQKNTLKTLREEGGIKNTNLLLAKYQKYADYASKVVLQFEHRQLENPESFAKAAQAELKTIEAESGEFKTFDLKIIATENFEADQAFSIKTSEYKNFLQGLTRGKLVETGATKAPAKGSATTAQAERAAQEEFTAHGAKSVGKISIPSRHILYEHTAKDLLKKHTIVNNQGEDVAFRDGENLKKFFQLKNASVKGFSLYMLDENGIVTTNSKQFENGIHSFNQKELSAESKPGSEIEPTAASAAAKTRFAGIGRGESGTIQIRSTTSET